MHPRKRCEHQADERRNRILGGAVRARSGLGRLDVTYLGECAARRWFDGCAVAITTQYNQKSIQ